MQYSVFSSKRVDQLHPSGNAFIQNAVEAVDLHSKTVCFCQLFGDVNIVSIVLSKEDNIFKCFTIFMKFTGEDGPPLPPMRSLHCCKQAGALFSTKMKVIDHT